MAINDTTKIVISEDKKPKEIIAWKAKIDGKWIWHHSHPKRLVDILKDQKINVHIDTIFFEDQLYRRIYNHEYKDRQLGYLEMEVNRFKVDEGDLKTQDIPNSSLQ